jgi:putative phage-type endonuclease
MNVSIAIDLQEYADSVEAELSLLEQPKVLSVVTELKEETRPVTMSESSIVTMVPVEEVDQQSNVVTPLKGKRIKKEPDLNPLLMRNINYLEVTGENVPKMNLSYEEIKARLNWINQQPVHEQRSEEWHTFRNGMITASEIYKLFASEKAIQTFIENKVNVKKYKSGRSCLHGIMFEPLARELYELQNNVKVYEYGCIKHQEISHLGASPDGICIEGNPELYGRLVEIKCPTTRVINGIVPTEYAIQVQLQLEVLNMEECDYCEFKFQEFASKEQYFQSEVKEKGITLSITDENGESLHIHSNFAIEGNAAEEWIATQTELVLQHSNVHLNKIYYWHVNQFHCKTIRRNRAFFNMIKDHVQAVWERIEQRQQDKKSQDETL